MSIVSVESYRSYGPAAAFVSLSDATIQWYIDAAERFAESYLSNRGYDLLTAAANDFAILIFKIVTWDLLVGVRGVNPADPAHAAAKMSRDEAIQWLRDVADGKANLGTGVEPARVRTGTAAIIPGSSTDTDLRGW